MAAKTFATYISELSAVTSLGAGDKIPVLESSTVKYVEGDDVGGGITELTGNVTASGAGSVVATIAVGAVEDSMIAVGIDAQKLADGTVSNTAFQYLSGVTSDIQTQLDAKAAKLPTVSSQPIDFAADGESGTVYTNEGAAGTTAAQLDDTKPNGTQYVFLNLSGTILKVKSGSNIYWYDPVLSQAFNVNDSNGSWMELTSYAQSVTVIKAGGFWQVTAHTGATYND